MHVKIISLPNCPNTPQTIALVKETAKEMQIAIDLEYVIVRTMEEAEEHCHIGSPTVQVEGRDIVLEARDTGEYAIT